MPHLFFYHLTVFKWQLFPSVKVVLKFVKNNIHLVYNNVTVRLFKTNLRFKL